MAIKLTVESFLNVVKQSGLIEKDQIKKFLTEFREQGVDIESSRAIADKLIEVEAITKWQADKLLHGKHKGFFLGKYKLYNLLGKGGMSSVYLAEHVLMRRRCAIKVLPSKRVKDSSYLARFHREAQAVASLDHPNIVRAYDVDQEVEKETEIHFLVMEYVDGCDLQELVIKNGNLSFVDAADYLRQAADGLEHAHKAGLVHRDIKPGNLLVDNNNNIVKILDLGLARFFDAEEENPLTVAHDEKVLGTADYLAPEQALDSHMVDIRADIYSLGCTIYYCLTGHPPFTEGTLAQRLMWHQTKQPPPIKDDRADIPDSLVAIIDKMMEKKPENRHQTAAEVSEAFTGWLVENATDEWKQQHPGFIGSGSGKDSGSGIASTIAPTASSDSSKIAAAPQPAAPEPAPVDQGFAAFLTGLDTKEVPEKKEPEPAPAPTPAAPAVQPTATTPAEPPLFPSAPAGATPEPEPPLFPSAQEPAVSTPAPAAKSQPVPPVAPAQPVPTTPPPAQPAAVAPPVTPAPVKASVAAQATPPDAPAPVAPPAVEKPVAAQPVTPAPAAKVTPAQPAAPSKVEEPPLFPSAPTEEPPARPAAPPAGATEAKPPAAAPVTAKPAAVAAEAKPPVVAAVAKPVQAAPVAAQPVTPAAPVAAVPVEAANAETIMAPPQQSQAAASSPVPANAPPEAPMFPTPPTGAETEEPQFPNFGAQAQPAAPVEAAAPAANQFGGFDPTAAPATPAPAEATTATDPAAASPTASLASRRKRSGQQFPLVPTIAGSAVVLIGLICYMVFAGGDDDSGDDKKPKVTKKTPKVEKNSTSGGTGTANGSSPTRLINGNLSVGSGGFATIGEALGYIRQHKNEFSRKRDINVTIAAGTYRERIVLDDSRLSYPKTGIRIKAEEGAKVTVQSSGSEPVVALIGDVKKVAIEGIDLVADNHPVAIELAGYIEGTILRNINVKGFTQAGVRGLGPQGFGGGYGTILLENVEFHSGSPTANGIELKPGASSSPSQIKVQNCRFFGPMAAGILIDANTSNLEVRESIFSDLTDGIKVNQENRNLQAIVFGNNTFYKIGRGIVFSNMPAPGSAGLEFSRNLFSILQGPEVVIENGYKEKEFFQFISTNSGSISNNWSDRKVEPDPAKGEHNIIVRPETQRVDTFMFVSATPSDAKFLAPAPTAPHKSVPGAQREYKPYIGAVAP